MLNIKSSLLVFLVIVLLFLVNAPQLFSHESKNNNHHEILSSPQDPDFRDGIRKVEHKAGGHDILDLDNGENPGICPQQRNTPQAPEAFQGMTNPLDPTPENLRAGETLFKIDARPTACKVCHGFDGDGLGIIFERLQPKPRNFTCYYTMEDISDGQIYWIVKNGSPGTPMPSFGALSDKQVWQLVLYIRQFAKK